MLEHMPRSVTERPGPAGQVAIVEDAVAERKKRADWAAPRNLISKYA